MPRIEQPAALWIGQRRRDSLHDQRGGDSCLVGGEAERVKFAFHSWLQSGDAPTVPLRQPIVGDIAQQTVRSDPDLACRLACPVERDRIPLAGRVKASRRGNRGGRRRQAPADWQALQRYAGRRHGCGRHCQRKRWR